MNISFEHVKYIYKVMARALKTVLVLTAIILLGIAVVRGYFNYQGYCFEQGRYLTDQEKIDRAVLRIINRIKKTGEPFPISVQAPKVWYKENGLERHERIVGWSAVPYAYNDLKDFYSKNPDCCRLVREIVDSDGLFRVDFWDRASGQIYAMVHIRFTVRFVGQGGMEHLGKAESYVAVTNCGHLWSGI